MSGDEPTVAVPTDDLHDLEYCARTLADVAQALGAEELATEAATLADRYHVARLEAVNGLAEGEA